MCPPQYQSGPGLAQNCNAYCQCMTTECAAMQPANCVATCMAMGTKWDLCCRLDKCLTHKCDYKDQLIGDCKAAVGIQACFDM
jgi:hypothetical protein